jgi:hypothetical protein
MILQKHLQRWDILLILNFKVLAGGSKRDWLSGSSTFSTKTVMLCDIWVLTYWVEKRYKLEQQLHVEWLIDSFISYGFTSRSRIFHVYGDVTIAGEGLQNLGLCSALRAFEQGEIFIVPRNLGFSGLIRRTAPFSRLLQHTRGCGRSILTRILTGTVLNAPLTKYSIVHSTTPLPYKLQLKDSIFLPYDMF